MMTTLNIIQINIVINANKQNKKQKQLQKLHFLQQINVFLVGKYLHNMERVVITIGLFVHVKLVRLQPQ